MSRESKAVPWSSVAARRWSVESSGKGDADDMCSFSGLEWGGGGAEGTARRHVKKHLFSGSR